MKVWIHIDGAQEGPYELENLPWDRMDANTPVWYEGLPDWMAASQAPATAYMVSVKHGAKSESDSFHQSSDVQNAKWQQQQRYQYYQPSAQAQGQESGRKCPPTFFVWSILLTVLCCNPVGIIPIITGSSTLSRFRNGNYRGARRMSETTEWWIMITIVTSLFMLPLSALMNLL